MSDRRDILPEGERAAGLSRRAVLSGMGAVGVAGALGGVGTLAYVKDTERAGARIEAGVLDLELCWTADEDCETGSDLVTVPITVAEKGDGGSATIRYQLPDDGRNNPGYVWFRTSCPVDACGLERDVEARLYRDDDCDGTFDRGELVEEGRLCDVLSRLNDGVLLDGDAATGEGDPIQPGETRCFGIEWELVDHLCGEDELEVSFQFRAEQARHATEPVSPWEGATCEVDCDDTTECTNCVPDEGGVSFLAFGGSELTERDVRLSVTGVNTDGELVACDWESEKPVDVVVMKLGNGYGAAKNGASTGGEFAMYEFSGPVDIEDFGTGSRGSVRSGEGTLIVDGEPWNPCPNGGVKYEVDEEAWERV
jgi:hypothetical protein